MLGAPVASSVYALSVPKITVDPGSLEPPSASQGFVTGKVSKGYGQRVVLYAKDGKTVIAYARLPVGKAKQKRRVSYRIQVPESYLNGKSASPQGYLVVYVQSRPIKGVAASKKVRVILSCRKFRKVQSIKVPAKVTLTNLKKTKRIKAKCASGLKLRYRSSRPKVISVNKKGKVIRKKNGKATITITQEGNSKYLPAVRKIRVVSRRSTRREQIDGAVRWAIRIAKDNRFAYGTGRGAHNYGCYYCGTNYGPRRHMKPSARYRKTYCCNPFVHAAYAHGAKHPKMLAACRAGSGIGMGKWTFYRYGCWKCVGKPSYRKLQKGDVLVNSYHVAMYVGKQRLVEAARGNWSASSIAVKHMSRSRYGGFSFVMRYTGY